MKVLKIGLVVLLVLVGLLLAGALALTPRFTVSRSVAIDAPVDTVYGLVADPRRWNDWAVWNRRDPTMKITYSGPPSGVGATWSWQSRSEGDGKMSFTAAEPGRRVAFDLYFPDFGTTSRGELAFAAEGSGTRVTWTMNGDMGSQLLFRYFALFADTLVGKDFEGGLANLKALAEKS